MFCRIKHNTGCHVLKSLTFLLSVYTRPEFSLQERRTEVTEEEQKKYMVPLMKSYSEAFKRKVVIASSYLCPDYNFLTFLVQHLWSYPLIIHLSIQ